MKFHVLRRNKNDDAIKPNEIGTNNMYYLTCRMRKLVPPLMFILFLTCSIVSLGVLNEVQNGFAQNTSTTNATSTDNNCTGGEG